MNVLEAKQLLTDNVVSMELDILKDLCFIVLDNPEFQTAPGGSEHHHNYEGGLIIHTAEVMGNAMTLANSLISYDQDVLVTAVVWHDYHKIKDYGIVNGDIVKMLYRKKIGHLSGSWAEFYCNARTRNVPEPIILDVGHCMLAHHGRREWGSPVEPFTPAAFVMHTADMLSMRGTNL